jgi:hypothetical protein
MHPSPSTVPPPLTPRRWVERTKLNRTTLPRSWVHPLACPLPPKRCLQRECPRSLPASHHILPRLYTLPRPELGRRPEPCPSPFLRFSSGRILDQAGPYACHRWSLLARMCLARTKHGTAQRMPGTFCAGCVSQKISNRDLWNGSWSAMRLAVGEC